MTRLSSSARLAAGVLALSAWIGLGIYLAAETARQDGNVLEALWINAGFLTDMSNLLLAVVMTAVALQVPALSRPHIVGWAIAAIATVGVGFWLIGGRLILGQSAVEDILLHGVTPLGGLLFWIVFVPKGQLRWCLAAVWLAWPLGYFSYALARGALTGEYAYPFLDPTKSTATEIALVVGQITLLFACWTTVLLVLDRMMGRKRP